MKRRFSTVRSIFDRVRLPRGEESGFTLVELLFIMALMTILMTLGAFAARQFWFQRSLTGGQDQIVTQMRALHAQVVAEGNSGRYQGAWFDPGSEDWGTIRYVSSTALCTSTGSFELDAGVEFESAAVATTAAEVDFVSPTDVAGTCRTQGASNSGADVAFVWFLSRGVATETTGNHIRLIQDRLDDSPTETIRVIGLTGRVEKV